MTVTHGVKLDEGTKARLKALGKARGRSPHWLMRTAIETYLEEEEKVEREKEEDKRRWENYQLTGHAIDHAQVTAWLEALAEGKAIPCPK